MVDVVLVQMPYASVERPSIALGTLKACLARDGIAATALYANLAFADRIGLDAYESINLSALDQRIGEWTFAAAAFPDADLDAEGYLRTLGRGLGHPPGLAADLLRVRDAAHRFVEDMVERVLLLRPRIVGCTSVFQQQCASLALLRRLKERDPSIVTLLGGGNCEGEMGWVTHRSFPAIDYVVSGEADDLIAPLCVRILVQGLAADVSGLGPGLFAPAHRADASDTPPTALYARVERMDRVPMPDYDDYFAALAGAGFRARVHPGITIETARGCWWGEKHHCAFCGISDSGMRFRAKPASQVLAEVECLEARHGIARFATADNIIERSYFRTLMPTLAAAARKPALFYQTKANLKRHEVALLAEAGVRWIQPGIESLDDRVLGRLEKGASAAINLQLVKWARRHGIWLLWNMLFGAPGEDDGWYADLAEWLPWIAHLQPPATGELTTIRYNRFSPYHQDPGAFGLRLVPGWAYAHTYPHDRERLSLQAYYFTDEADAARSEDRTLRPGVVAVDRCLRAWTAAFVDGTGPMATMRPDAPVLSIERCGDRLVVRDTRPCAVDDRHELDPLEARVLDACDAAVSLGRVAEALGQGGLKVATAQIERAAERLIARKLVRVFGDTVLALPIEDAATYAPPLDFPAGLLLPPGPARRRAPRPAGWAAGDMPVSAFADAFGAPPSSRVLERTNP